MSFPSKKSGSFPKRGFSLVEMTVAVTVMVFSIVGPMSVAQKSLSSARYSKDQIIAYYLAEEGLEYIKYLRDQNSFQINDDWLKNLDFCFNDRSNQRGCAVDLRNTPHVQRCTSISDPKCRLNTEEGAGEFFFTHKQGVPRESTVFSRIVRIKHVVDGADFPSQEERLVESEVRWKTGNLPEKTIILQTYIFDWRRQPSQKFQNF